MASTKLHMLLIVTLILSLVVSHSKTECVLFINTCMVAVVVVAYSQLNILGVLLIVSLIMKQIDIFL